MDDYNHSSVTLKEDGPDTILKNIVFRVRDDLGNDVEDYVIEFYQNTASAKDRIARMFNRDVIVARGKRGGLCLPVILGTDVTRCSA